MTAESHSAVMTAIEEIARASSPHIYTEGTKAMPVIDIRTDVSSAIVRVVDKYLNTNLGHEFAINIAGRQDLSRLRRAFPEYSVNLRGDCVIFRRKSLL